MDKNAVYVALATCSGTALLIIGLAIPLLKGKIKRNHWYGFRTPKTLSSDAVWYPANREAAANMMLAGVIILLTALVLWLAGRFLTAPQSVITMASVTFFALVGAVVKSFVSLSRY